MSGDWIEWIGGECPVADDVLVEAKLRSGHSGARHSQTWNWRHYASIADIVAYRVIDQPKQRSDGSLTREEVLRMAQEAGLCDADGFTPDDYYGLEGGALERFAALVAAAEREECAKVCDGSAYDEVRDIAEAIRARGKP